jgi:predicted RNA-binding protein with TRAM domain
MEPSDPLCLFTGRVERRDNEYIITIPEHEIDLGTIASEGTYRMGMYPAVAQSGTADTTDSANTDQRPSGRFARSESSSARSTSSVMSATPETASGPDGAGDGPPVNEGETLRLEIEDVGDQGDGIARVGPGYVVFVPDTEIGQEPLVRVTTVHETFAFAEIVEEEPPDRG